MSPYNVTSDDDYDDVIDNLFPNFKENPSWKCGEIYTWNNEEVFAVECTLCDDTNLRSLLEFPKHMQDYHPNHECNVSEGEPSWHRNAAETISELDEINERNGVAKEDGGVLPCSDEESKHRSKKLDIETKTEPDECEAIIKTGGIFHEIFKEENISKEKSYSTNRDQLWRKIVSEKTADEIEAQSAINYIRLHNDDNQTVQAFIDQQLHQIAAGQEQMSSLQEEQDAEEEATNVRKRITQSIKDPSLPIIKSRKQRRITDDLSPLQPKLNPEQIIFLIELYKIHPRLWNPTHEEFSHTELCDESWNEISSKFNEITKQTFKINELKLAVSLLCQRYRAKNQEKYFKDNLKFNYGDGDESKEENDGVDHLKILYFLKDQLDAGETRRLILYKQNLKIIEIYKKFPILWHSSHKHKQSPVERYHALDKMSDILKQEHQIELSRKSIQGRLHALHKYYQKDKFKHLGCLKNNRKFRTNFKHFRQMQFLRKHIAPFECNSCSKIFEKLHERNEHTNTWHHKNAKQRQQDCRPVDILTKDEKKLKKKSTNDAKKKAYNSEIIARVKETDLATDGVEANTFLANLLEKESFMETVTNVVTQNEESDISQMQVVYVNKNNRSKNGYRNNEDKLLEIAPQSLLHNSMKQVIAENDVEAANKQKTYESTQFTQESKNDALLTTKEISNLTRLDTFQQLLNPLHLQEHPTISNEFISPNSSDKPVANLNTQILLNLTEKTNPDKVKFLEILNSPKQNLSLLLQQHQQQTSPSPFETIRIPNAIPSTFPDSSKSIFNFQYISYDKNPENRISPQMTTELLTQTWPNAFSDNSLNVSESKNLLTQFFYDDALKDSTYEITKSSDLLDSAQTFQIVDPDSTQVTRNYPFHTISSPAISNDQYFLESPPLKSNSSVTNSINSTHLDLNSPSFTIFEAGDNMQEHLNSTSPHILESQYYLNIQKNLDVPSPVLSHNFNLAEEILISPQDITTEIILTTKDDTSLLQKLMNPSQINAITQPGAQYTLKVAQNNSYLEHEVLFKNFTGEKAEVLNTQNFLHNIFHEEQLNTNIQTSKPIPIYTTNNLVNHDISQYIIQSFDQIPNIYFNNYQPVGLKGENASILTNKTQPTTYSTIKFKELPKNEISVYEILVNNPLQLKSSEQRDNTHAIIITQKPINLLQGLNTPPISVNHHIGNVVQHNFISQRTATNEINLTQNRDEQLMTTSLATSTPPATPSMVAYSRDNVTSEYITVDTMNNNKISRSSNISKPIVLNGAIQPTKFTIASAALTRGCALSNATPVSENNCKLDLKNLKPKIKNPNTQYGNQSESGNFEVKAQDSIIQCEVFIPEFQNFTSTDSITLIPCTSISNRFNEKRTRNLISIYKEHPILWNPFHMDFHSRTAEHIAWKSITIEFNKLNQLRVPWQTIYKKLTDLVKCYRKEKERIKKKNITSKWYCYKDFQFLDEYLDITSDTNKTIQENEVNLKLIEIYKTYPQLWNTHLLQFRRRSQRSRHIQAMLNSLREELNIRITLDKLKRKLLEFRCSYRQEKKKRIECTQNNEAFESFYEYYQQLDFLEPHISPFVCKVCSESFKKVTEITRHYRLTKHQKLSRKRIHVRAGPTSEIDAKSICHICGAKFTMRNNLIYHLNRHIGKRTHSCKLCPKSFYNSTSLRVHERSHTKDCPCICVECGQGFVNNSKLNQHRKRHGDQRDHVCNVCNKAFFTAFERDKHAKSHLKIRNQICPICGKAFYFGSAIYTHMEIHNAEKKYVCKICDKRFSQNSGLYRHKKSHLAKDENQ